MATRPPTLPPRRGVCGCWRSCSSLTRASWPRAGTGSRTAPRYTWPLRAATRTWSSCSSATAPPPWTRTRPAWRLSTWPPGTVTPPSSRSLSSRTSLSETWAASSAWRPSTSRPSMARRTSWGSSWDTSRPVSSQRWRSQLSDTWEFNNLI